MANGNGRARALTMTPELLARLRRIPGDDAAGALASMAQSGVQGGNAGVVVLRKTFQYQSFFDSGFLERAILSQPPEPIIPSTKQSEDTAGYGIAIYPASESPVAVQIMLGGGRSGGTPFIMRPGEVYRSSQPFDGIRYGLPYGWLGGGTVQLRVLQGQHDDVSFLGEKEILFHRIRLPVWGVAGNPAAINPNWPTAFPWPNAYDFNGNAQKGQPSLVVSPTRTVVRLRTNGTLAAAIAGGFRMRAVFYQTDDFDLNADGATYDTAGVSGAFVDLPWAGGNAASGFRIGGLNAEFPLFTFDPTTVKIGGTNAIAAFIDMDSVLPAGSFVDVERYGIV